ncbi:ribonuclease H-like protein [Aureobasidium subglaciale]|nr:ribonuclease H-like protein [Aureobasidium subglaciale]
MQSAGRAVTSSHHTSLYTSSRNALSRPARWAAEPARSIHNATATSTSTSLDNTWDTPSPIILAAPRVRRHLVWRNPSTFVSSPLTQKRGASSKPKPPYGTLRTAPGDAKSRVPKPLVYKGRDTGSSGKQYIPHVLDPNPYARGRPINPSSASPNAIFDPQVRRPIIVQRPPPTPLPPRSEETPPAPTPFVSSAPPEDPPQTSLPKQEPQDSQPDPIPIAPPNISSQSPLRSAPGQELAHAVDAVDVPEGIVAERPPVSQSRDIEKQVLETIESRASASDQVLLLDQKNKDLGAALAQHRKDHKALLLSHYELQKKSALVLENTKRNAREKVQAVQEKSNLERTRLQQTVRERSAESSKLLVQLDDLRKELKAERDTVRRQSIRRAGERQYEATLAVREREEKEKAARKALHSDYDLFRNWSHVAAKQIKALIFEPDLLKRELTFLTCEINYWTKALRNFRSFEGTTKSGDELRFWEAGVQVQKKARGLGEREVLQKRAIDRLQHRLRHRDSVFGQVKAYLNDSTVKVDNIRQERCAGHKQLQTVHDSVMSLQHDHRRLLRANRYDMDPGKGSPERAAASRASTVDVYELYQPIGEIQKTLGSLMDFWKGKINQLRVQDPTTLGLEADESFIRAQVRSIGLCKALLISIRRLSTLQLEALEAEWVSNQPLHQQLAWQNSMRVVRRQTQIQNSTKDAVRSLRADGMRSNHKILSVDEARDIIVPSQIYVRAAFAHAYVKSKNNAFNREDIAELSEVMIKYRSGNTQDTRHYLRQLEQVSSVTRDLALQRSVGKRELIPARPRRNRSSRKAALAKAKHDGDAENQEPNAKTAVRPAAEASSQASSAEMTSKDASPEKTADLDESVPTQQTSTKSLKSNANIVPDSTANSAPKEDRPTSTESLLGPETTKLGPENKKIGPSFKSIKLTPAPIPRLAPTPKVATVYSRARSRLGFRPPTPMFKETRRRSQAATTSSADCFEKTELELQPLLYHIPPQDLRNALMASKTSQAAFWRYSLYKSPSGEKPLVHYCTKFEQAEQVAKYFAGQQIIGFDIEWEMGSSVAKGSIKDNVSLIQIACDDRIALFQVALFAGESKEDLMPPSLKIILESPDIFKAGVNIAGDFTRLRKCLGVEGQGIFELSHLYKLVKFSEKEPAKVNKSPLKLADQVQDVLFLPLSKGNVRTSAWSRRLSMEQVEYAATDAYAGFRLFQELDKARSSMTPTPPRPALWEANQPIVLGNGERAGETRTKRKTTTEKVAEAPEVESQSMMLSPEEEQALNDEEEEARAEAGVDGIDEDNIQEDLESFESEPAPIAKHEAAEKWLGQWESNLAPERKGKNTPTNIRAYALWQIQGLTLQQVAEAMRQPPLALTTVASYVLEVVKSESLSYDSARLQEALDILPSVAHWRYRSLILKTRSEI